MFWLLTAANCETQTSIDIVNKIVIVTKNNFFIFSIFLFSSFMSKQTKNFIFSIKNKTEVEINLLKLVLFIDNCLDGMGNHNLFKGNFFMFSVQHKDVLEGLVCWKFEVSCNQYFYGRQITYLVGVGRDCWCCWGYEGFWRNLL